MPKRWTIYLCFLVVLAAGAVAVYPGIFSAREAVPATADVADAAQPVEDEDPLTAFRTEREQLRAMQTAQLNEIVYGEKTDDEMRALAQQKLIELADWSEKELTIEGVLRARGYADAVATVHTDSANVLVRADAVNRQESAVILELVVRETGLRGGNVKIIPIN